MRAAASRASRVIDHEVKVARTCVTEQSRVTASSEKRSHVCGVRSLRRSSGRAFPKARRVEVWSASGRATSRARRSGIESGSMISSVNVSASQVMG